MRYQYRSFPIVLAALVGGCGWRSDDAAGLPMTHGTSLGDVRAVGVADDGQGWALLVGSGTSSTWATFHTDDFEAGFEHQGTLPVGPHALAVAREDGRAWIMAGEEVFLADPAAGLVPAGTLSTSISADAAELAVNPQGNQLWMSTWSRPWERWSILDDGTLGESLGTNVPGGACSAQHDGTWLYFLDCSGATRDLRRSDEQVVEVTWETVGYAPLGFAGDYVQLDPRFPPWDYDGDRPSQEDPYVRGYDYLVDRPATPLSDGSFIVGTWNGLVWVGHGEHDKGAIEDTWCNVGDGSDYRYADGWLSIDGVDLGTYELSGRHSLTVTQSSYDLQNWYAYTASDTVMDVYSGVEEPSGGSNDWSQTTYVGGLFYRGGCDEVVARANAR